MNDHSDRPSQAEVNAGRVLYPLAAPIVIVLVALGIYARFFMMLGDIAIASIKDALDKKPECPSDRKCPDKLD